MRIAVLFDNFGPYHFARLNAAASILELVGIETVGESSEYDWTAESRADFERVTLYPKTDSGDRADSNLQSRLASKLSEFQPDAIAIPGWSAKAAFAALSWCAQARAPAILMSESTADDEPRSAWREAIKRRIVRLYSTALVGGRRHVDYLVQLGMPRERIFTGYDVVENRYFADKAAEVRSRTSDVGGPWSAVRGRHRLPENYFLASARFIAKKNLPTLIRAYAEYRKAAEVRGQRAEVRADIRHPTSDIWSLVLLGDGPLRSGLCCLISDLGLQNCVLLPGFKQYDELPVYYGLANAFVHASTTEQWGLVVNEAMASGLPVIVSNRCGCVPELVHEGVNGFTFDPNNQEQITENLLSMSAMPEGERAAFGQASEKIVAEHGVDRFALGLKNAAELAMSLPHKRAGILDRALLRGLMGWGARAPSRAG